MLQTIQERSNISWELITQEGFLRGFIPKDSDLVALDTILNLFITHNKELQSQLNSGNQIHLLERLAYLALSPRVNSSLKQKIADTFAKYLCFSNNGALFTSNVNDFLVLRSQSYFLNKNSYFLRHSSHYSLPPVLEESPLVLACRRSNLQTIQSIISASPGLMNLPETYDNTTPLLAAAENNTSEIVSFLLEKGANPLAANNRNITAFHFACARGELFMAQKIFQFLKQQHQDNLHNLVDNTDCNPLMIASKCGQNKVVEWLINIGMDPTREQKSKKRTAFHFTCNSNHLETLKLLVSKLKEPPLSALNKQDSQGLTPLSYACWMGHSKIVSYLLEQNVNPLIQAIDGQTSLYWAAKSLQSEVFKNLLLKSIACINTQSSVGLTALHHACKTQNEQAALALLEKKPNLALQTKYGNLTALHYACINGMLTVVEEILSEDSTLLNLTSSSGNTPLIYACKEKRSSVALALIARGAILTAQSEDDRFTALHYACSQGLLDVVKALLAKDPALLHFYSSSELTPLTCACKTGQNDVILYLMNPLFQLNPSQQNAEGWSALHYACMGGASLDAIELLVTQDTLNLKTSNGCSALEIACLYNRKEIASRLVQKGALFPSTHYRQFQSILSQLNLQATRHAPYLQMTLSQSHNSQTLKLDNAALDILEKLFSDHWNCCDLTKRDGIQQGLTLLLQSWDMPFTCLPAIKSNLLQACNSQENHLKIEATAHQKNLLKATTRTAIEKSCLEATQLMDYVTLMDRFFQKLFGGRPNDLLPKIIKEISFAITNIKSTASIAKKDSLSDKVSQFRERDIYAILFLWGVGGQGEEGNKRLREECGTDNLYQIGLETGADLLDTIGINVDLYFMKETNQRVENIKEHFIKKVSSLNHDNPLRTLFNTPKNWTIDEMVNAEISYNLVKIKNHVTVKQSSKRTKLNS